MSVSISVDESNDAVEFIKEIHSFAVDLLIKPSDSFINFLLS